jgi:CRISPR-associated protein Cas2
MMILVSYDVSTVNRAGRRRLRRVAKACEGYGVRVQNSVFECDLDPAQWAELQHKLLEIINEDEDSLRFYFLGSNWRRKVEHHGTKTALDLFQDTLVV